MFGQHDGLIAAVLMMSAILLMSIFIERFNRRSRENYRDAGNFPEKLPGPWPFDLNRKYDSMTAAQKAHFWRRHVFVGRYLLIPFFVATGVVWFLAKSLDLTIPMALVAAALYFFSLSGGRR